MNLSMKWLQEFVDLQVEPRAFSEAVTMSGSKVEGYEIEGEGISGIVVGKVLSIEKHPDADKLVVCSIDVAGERPLQIVTGASNLTVGDVVPVCLDGAVLPDGKKIKKGKLRGVLSEGMLCSLSELGLTAHDFPYAIEDGIFVLQNDPDLKDVRLGQDICSAIGLNDTKIEFEITSNRPDCFSVIGLAREAAVTYGRPLKLHKPEVKGGEGDITDYLSVSVEAPDLCKRYMARIVKDVKIAPSPLWMRQRLRAMGVRPINNIVDITNYVMLEYGQPMHAFDHRHIAGGRIVVRRAAAGESIVTLDGVERKLTEKMLVIADADKPSAVAGVMGGEYSGILEDTDTLVFESACFDGPSVRTTARDIGLRTDSSSRFEKGLDPNTCPAALDRALELVEKLGAGRVVGGVIDVDNSDRTARRAIPFQPDWINRFLGIDLSREQMVKILTDLCCAVEGDTVIPPSFRPDLEHKADIAEEIARMYGYNKIPTTRLKGSAEGQFTPVQKFQRLVGDTMLALGYDQINTYSFISPKYYDKIGLPADSTLRDSVTIRNPLGEDTSVMRTTALPSMLEILSGNYRGRNLEARLFELATEYRPAGADVLPEEKLRLILGGYGGDMDFFDMKGAVESLLEACGVTQYSVQRQAGRTAFHPGRCADLFVTLPDRREPTLLGTIGEVHPRVLETYGVGLPACAAELDMEVLFQARTVEKTYQPLPRFPAVTRDLALLCEADIPVAALQNAIAAGAGRLLERVQLFDVYQGKQIPDGKKSVAYSVTLRSKDATLTDAETDRAVAKMIKELQKLGAELRQ